MEKLRNKIHGSRDPYAGMTADIQGWASTSPVFADCIRELNPKLIIEVGTWKGCSAIHMAKICLELYNDFEIVYLAINKYSEEGKIPGASQYATKVQQCAVALQLVKYNNISQRYVKLDSQSPVEKQIADLRSYVDNEISNWSWPKWQLVVTALRVFETKLSICNENVRNGNFWKPADTN